MMNIALMNRWIEALESGKYPQCQGALHNFEGYCCLGVLVDIEYGPDTWIDMSCDAEKECFGYSNSDYGELLDDFPDNDLMDDVGINEMEIGPSDLSGMNDDGQSFAEIAAYLRERLAEYLAAQEAQ